jgi:hypothetical protein
MEQEKIKELLGKFYEGNTSEEEEAMLKEYLADPSVASMFPEAEYIAEFGTVVPEPSSDFLNKLEAVTHPRRKMTSRKEMIRYSITVAATAVLLIGTYLLFDYLRPDRLRDTYSDPEIAMAEVRIILTTVSQNMNTGTEPLGSMRAMSVTPEAMGEFGKLNKAVGKNLDKLRYLNGLNTTTNTTNNK